MKLRVPRRMPHAAVLIGLAALLSWGCSRSVTGPDSAGPASIQDSFARVVRSEQLDAFGPASGDSLAAATRDQDDVELSLRRAAPGLLGTAVSTFEGRPVVLALTRTPIGALPGRIARREVVQLVVGDVAAQAFCCGTSTGRADECSSGTLGAIVTDGVRNYWLSNWHVFVHPQGKVGDAIDAPGRYDAGCGTSNLVGTVSRFTPLRFDGSTNTVDCAIARIIPGTSVSSVQAAGTNSFVPSATIKTATVGLAVKKVGRSTGFTTGKVIAVNASLAVAYGGIGSANFKGVVLFSHLSEPGDSGSLICSQSGSNPVALLFAGSSTTSVGCPIGAVFTAVGAHVPN